MTIISAVYMSDFLCLYIYLSYVSHYSDTEVYFQTAAGVWILGANSLY